MHNLLEPFKMLPLIVTRGLSRKTASYQFDGGVGGKCGKVGVVLLAADQTLEYELTSVLSSLGVGCFFSRLKMDDDVTPETLRAMKERISGSAKLILPGTKLDMLAYGCTSASATMGEDEVFAQLACREPTAVKTTPITSAVEGLKMFNTKKLGLVTPYNGAVNDILINYLERQGEWKVRHMMSFNLVSDTDVASVAEESVKEAAIEVAGNEDVDTVFISCTNLRTMNIIKQVEKETGKPVTSSNMSMAWHIVRRLGINNDLSGKYGSLFNM